MTELIHCGGAEFVVRAGSVDRESVEWVWGSSFMRVLRETPISAQDTVLDLGAHIGAFSVFAAREKGCRIVAFEPDPDSLRLARANAELNSLGQSIEAHGVAIGAAQGSVTLHESFENWAHTTVAGGGPYNKLTGNSRLVRMISLKEALAYGSGRATVLAKFNIEGAEFGMFETATVADLGQLQVLVGEIHFDIGDGDIHGVVEKLRAAGFVVELERENDLRAIMVARRC